MDWEIDSRGEGEVTFLARASPGSTARLAGVFKQHFSLFFIFFFFSRRAAPQNWSKKSRPSFYTSFGNYISPRLPTCPVSIAITQSTQ